jgi:hypothetical protein
VGIFVKIQGETYVFFTVSARQRLFWIRGRLLAKHFIQAFPTEKFTDSFTPVADGGAWPDSDHFLPEW